MRWTIASSSSATASPVLADTRITSSGSSPSSSAISRATRSGSAPGQVDLVERRDQLEAGVDRQVGVGHRLRLHPLGGVHQQQRAVAGRQRARHLVGEVHVPGRVDQVEAVELAVARRVLHAHGLGLDRDAALALELHRVEQLRPVVARVDRPGDLEDAVGQRGLPVIDVGDDREVADVGCGSAHLPPSRVVATVRLDADDVRRSRLRLAETGRALGLGADLAPGGAAQLDVRSHHHPRPPRLPRSSCQLAATRPSTVTVWSPLRVSFSGCTSGGMIRSRSA